MKTSLITILLACVISTMRAAPCAYLENYTSQIFGNDPACQRLLQSSEQAVGSLATTGVVRLMFVVSRTGELSRFTAADGDAATAGTCVQAISSLFPLDGWHADSDTDVSLVLDFSGKSGPDGRARYTAALEKWRVAQAQEARRCEQIKADDLAERNEYVRAHSELTDKQRTAILTHELALGLSEAAIERFYGIPASKGRTVDEQQDTAVWIYPRAILYFRGGVLVRYTVL